MQNNIRFLPDDIVVSVPSGMTVSDAMQTAAISITHPCGGRGTCGRCIVQIDDEPVKACVTKIDRDMVVHIPSSLKTGGQKVLTDIRLYDPEQNILPLVEKINIEMSEPSLTDSVSDAQRLINALSAKLKLPHASIWIEHSCLTNLSKIMRENIFNVNVTIFYEKNGVTVLSVSGVSNSELYGIAVDIGTTTVAVSLTDLKTGQVLDTMGLPNPQAEYGSDVISRIVFTEENEKGTEILQKAIIKTLSDCVTALSLKQGISSYDIPVMVLAANTVMSHFLLNLPTDFLRREPYVPVASEYPLVTPKDLDLPLLPCGRILVIPSISSYVGGDITAGVIATNLPAKEGLNLLVDIGTNGEMVLAGEGFMMACSCSAGPAFEGSGITCGSRAIEGAINNATYKDGKMICDVIGGEDVLATSICGSGLISLISAMLDGGIINRSGRFVNGEKEYNVTPLVTINEADIQNLIRAKGAIFAGMRVLLNNMELSLSDLDHIFIAGGFGKSLDIDNSIGIGMLPQLHTINDESYAYVGNSALAGALRVLNDRTINMYEIAQSIMNLELSIGNEFMDEFMMASFLPHTDLSIFEKK